MFLFRHRNGEHLRHARHFREALPPAHRTLLVLERTASDGRFVYRHRQGGARFFCVDFDFIFLCRCRCFAVIVAEHRCDGLFLDGIHDFRRRFRCVMFLIVFFYDLLLICFVFCLQYDFDYRDFKNRCLEASLA